MNNAYDPNPPPSAQLMRMIFGYVTTQTIAVAARLGLADLLVHGAKSVDELAISTGMMTRPLYRVLRVLASVGVFVEDEKRCFRLTPMAEVLRSDTPDTLRNFAILSGSELHWNVWSDLLYTLQSGKPNFERIYGRSYFEHLANDPALADAFNGAMTNFSASISEAVISEYDFSGINCLVDVGGGQGALLAAILVKYPFMNGVLFDLPSVIAGARELLDTHGVATRCEAVGGDFFVSIPDGGDAYLLQHIIHDWDDDQATAILRNCRHAMGENGKLLMIEIVIPDDDSRSLGKFLDLDMMMYSRGCERTESEYCTLFGRAGFEIARIIPTRSLHSIVEATPL